MLDLDDVSYEEAMALSFKSVKDFKLEGFALAESSRKHYHIVFNRKTSKSRVISIIASVCLETRHEGLTRWFLEQCTRGDFTLRISAKGKKPPPRIVYRHGKQDKQICEYLQFRRMMRFFMTLTCTVVE